MPEEILQNPRRNSTIPTRRYIISGEFLQMAHLIDWDNIDQHIHYNDVRYMRRLRRKQLYITCSPFISHVSPAHATSTLNKLQTVKHVKTYDVDPDMEMFKEGFRECDRFLVCKVDDNVSDDVSLKKLENVQHGNNDFWVECSNVVGNSEPIGVKCGTRGNFVDPDVKMFKEDLKVRCGTRENVVDPDFKMLTEDLKVDGRSFALKVKKKDGSIEYIEYEKDDLCKEYQTKGDNVKNVLGTQKGDSAKNLINNLKKRKRDKVVPTGDVNFVSTQKKRNVMVHRKVFSRNSNRFSVAKRSSVVKRRDDLEIIFIGKPNEIEEVRVGKNTRPSKIIKENKRPSKMEDGRNIEYPGKSKKRYEKLDRRPCLTRTDHVSNQMDISGKGRRHVEVLTRGSAKYRRTTSGNKQRDLVVQQGKDIENKEEKLDNTTNVVLVKKSMKMIQGKDSVDDDNLPPHYKCDKKFGKYSEVKEENATSLNYNEEENERSPDLEILRKPKKQHEKLERRPSLTRTDHVSNPMNIAGKAKKHLAVLSRQSAEYRITSPRNKRRDLVVQQGEDIEKSRFSSGTGNMDVMVQEGKFDDSTNEVLVKKSTQMIHGRDSVYDDNLRPRYKCDKKFGKYAEVKEKNANSLKYDEEDNEHSSDLEVPRKSKKQHDKLERRICLTRADHVIDLTDIAGKAKRQLEVLSGHSAKYLRTSPRNEQRDLMVQQGVGIENSIFSSGKANMAVMVKEEKFDDSTNLVLVEKSKQMIQGRDSVYDNNLRPRYKCDRKFGNYAEVKGENANSLKYEQEDNEHSSDLEILRKSKEQHEKLERRSCLTRADHVSDPTDTAGKAKRYLAVLSRQNAKYRRAIPRNKRRDLVVRQGEDIENSIFSSGPSGTGNMALMVKEEEKFDDSTNVFLVEKSMQMFPGRDSVYDNNLRPQYKCDKKLGEYAEVKEENAKRLNYDEENNEDSSDLEILDMDNQQNLSKFELMKVFNDSVIEDNPVSMKIANEYETSAFREELMDILKKPYNLEEYRSLMQKAKYRHLNWGPEYSDGLKGKEIPNTYGKSPLDYHPDVQRRLRRCRRISKRLNILRGFIYWYGRTCQDGAFKPWLDKSCLRVTPSPR